MKLFQVELAVTVMVVANSALDAEKYAERHTHKILSDESQNIGANYATEIKSMAELNSGCTDGWDGECIPYGGDGNTKIKDLLPEETPFVDTKTADMFAA